MPSVYLFKMNCLELISKHASPYVNTIRKVDVHRLLTIHVCIILYVCLYVCYILYPSTVRIKLGDVL